MNVQDNLRPAAKFRVYALTCAEGSHLTIDRASAINIARDIGALDRVRADELALRLIDARVQLALRDSRAQSRRATVAGVIIVFMVVGMVI